MSIVKETSLALKWSAAGKLTSQLISWTVTLVVIRILTPEDYGLLAIATIFTSLLMMMGEAGMQAVVIRSESLELGHLKRIFGVIFAGHSLVSIIILLVAPLVATFYTEPRVVPIMLVLAAHNMVICYTEMPNALLRREMRFRELAFIEIAGIIVQSLISLALAVAGYGVWALVWGQLVAGVVRAVLLNAVRPFLRLPSFHMGMMRDELHFGGYILLQRLVWWALESFDRVLLGKLLGPVQLGYYTVAFDLATIPRNKLAQIINEITFPAVSKIKDDLQLARDHVLKAIQIMALFVFPVFFGISAIAGDIVNVILGQKWLAVAVPLTFLPIAMAFRLIVTPISQLANALGFPEIVFRFQVYFLGIIASAISIGAFWGIVGVSIAWFVAAPIKLGLLITLTRKRTHIGLKELFAAIRWPLVASIAMYGTVFITKRLLLGDQGPVADLFLALGPTGAGIMRLCILFLVGALSYAAVSMLINRRSITMAIAFIRNR